MRISRGLLVSNRHLMHGSQNSVFFISQHRFSSSSYDSTLFIQTLTSLILVLVYVDDMVITVDIAHICIFQHFLNHNFEMKDLGTLH